MYNENYKTLLREIKENKWKHISWRFNKIKMSVLPRESYRFNVIPFKIPKFFFQKRKTHCKRFTWNLKSLQITKQSWKTKVKLEDSHFLVSKLTTKLQRSKKRDTGIKTDIWNRIESPEIYPPIYDQMIFDKGIQALQWRKGQSFNKWCWENWIFTYQRVKFDPYLTSCTKMNSKWIKDLNVRPKNIFF